MAGEQQPRFDVAASYDHVAELYAAAFFEELARKPFDRVLLDSFAESVRGRGQTCDLGCGPGHVARYLHERGVGLGAVVASPIQRVRRRTRPWEDGRAYRPCVCLSIFLGR